MAMQHQWYRQDHLLLAKWSDMLSARIDCWDLPQVGGPEVEADGGASQREYGRDEDAELL